MELKKRFIVTGLTISLSSAILPPILSFLLGMTRAVIIRNSLLSVFFSLFLFLGLWYFYKSGKLDYDNAEHPYRFMIPYLAGLLLSMAFPFIDKKGWPFMCILVALSLFSNSLLGMYATGGLIMISVMQLESADITVFIVYFISCFVACLLFQDIEYNFKVVPSILISCMVLLTLETAGFIVPENKVLSAETFIMPIVNVMVNVLAMFLCLKYFNEHVANRYRNKYLELNDQGYKVLQDLKNVSQPEYFRSIHTAYLTERMAVAIGCDVDVAKNCAYYHRIRKAFGYTVEECRSFVTENRFPPKAAETLIEYINNNPKLDSREAGIVFISDRFVASLQSILAKDPKAKINYENLYDTIINSESVKKSLSESSLTINDCRLLKEVVLREKLYYDFLR